LGHRGDDDNCGFGKIGTKIIGQKTSFFIEKFVFIAPILIYNRYGSVGTTEIENRIFGFFIFLPFKRWQRRIRLL
jgi:hypothetical protein